MLAVNTFHEYRRMNVGICRTILLYKHGRYVRIKIVEELQYKGGTNEVCRKGIEERKEFREFREFRELGMHIIEERDPEECDLCGETHILRPYENKEGMKLMLCMECSEFYDDMENMS